MDKLFSNIRRNRRMRLNPYSLRRTEFQGGLGAGLDVHLVADVFAVKPHGGQGCFGAHSTSARLGRLQGRPLRAGVPVNQQDGNKFEPTLAHELHELHE